MNWYERVEQLRKLAFIDESAPYEVDQAGIFIDPANGKFVLLTAAGCSCWGGEYDEEQFDTLEDLCRSLTAGERNYTPSLSGAMELIEEAQKSMRGDQ